MERLTGAHAVIEALRARRRRLHRLWVAPGARAGSPEREAADVAARIPIPVDELAPGGDLERSQGLVLEAERLPEATLEALLEGCAGEAPWLVALDGIEDPQNLGAIARVADAAGCAGLILTRRHAPPLSAAVSRASAGAIEHLPVARVPNLGRALDALRDHGFWSLAADPEGPASLYELADRVWEGPLVFVLGAEGRGLRANIRERVDHRVQIPMEGHVASLNVASASAVLLYEAVRRRASRKSP